MENKKVYFKLFKDILKENGKFSQGRVYLLWSIVAYYITLGILTAAGIRKDDIEIANFKLIVDALEYAMTLFAGYVFGGKALEVIKTLKGVGVVNDVKEVVKKEVVKDDKSKEKNDEHPSDADNV